MSRRAVIGWLVPLAIAGSLVVLYFAWPGFRDVVDEGLRVVRSGDRDQLSHWVRSLGGWGPFAIVALSIAQTVLFVVPSTLIIVASVLAYGPFGGGLLAWLAILGSSTLAYGAGRWLSDATVSRLVGETKGARLREWVKRYGFWGLAIGRLSPLFPHDALSLVAGLAAMGYLRFVLATAIGATPLVALLAVLGESFDRLERGLIWLGVVSGLGYVAWVAWDRHRTAPRRRARAAGRGRRRRDERASGRA